MLRSVLLAALAVLLSGCELADVLSDAHEAPPVPPGEVWGEMVAAVNAARAQGARCGATRFDPAPPLIWEGRLTEAAFVHTEDMAAREVLSHVGGDGSRVSDRATRAGYRWSRVGENLAKGHASVEEVVRGWLSSPSHCRGLMDDRYTEMGAAEKDRFWTLVMARPRQ